MNINRAFTDALLCIPLIKPNRTVISVRRREYRARDFGVGYGNSSGYARDKRYTSDWGQLRFRCS